MGGALSVNRDLEQAYTNAKGGGTVEQCMP